MNVAIAWWPITSGGSQQAVRGNVKAFIDAGHDVDVYPGAPMQILENLGDHHDLLVVPFIQYDGNWEQLTEDIHVHLQAGGFPKDIEEEKLARSFEYADTVSVLDPSMLDLYVGEIIDVDYDDIALIPNPPNRDLFERSPREEAGERFLASRVGSFQKGDNELHEVANHAPTEEFFAHHVSGAGTDKPRNVTYYPVVPWTSMPRKYRQAYGIINPCKKDILPNTAFEAFMTGRPYITRASAIGHIQAVPPDHLDPTEFGVSVEEWQDRHGEAVGDGTHFYASQDPAELGNACFEVATDEELWAEMVEAGFEYLDAWEGWGWKEKADTIIEHVEEQQ